MRNAKKAKKAKKQRKPFKAKKLKKPKKAKRTKRTNQPNKANKTIKSSKAKKPRKPGKPKKQRKPIKAKKPNKAIKANTTKNVMIIKGLYEYYQTRIDNRHPGHIKYKLPDLLMIATLACFLAYSSWEQVYKYAVDNAANIMKMLPTLPGIPSGDTIGKAVAVTNFDDLPNEFAWIGETFVELSLKRPRGRPPKSEMLGTSLDGKSLRGAKKRGQDKTDTHIVNVVCNGFVMTFDRVNSKNNEIVANDHVVDILHKNGLVKGRVFTTDALGCQRRLVEKIIGMGGSFFFCVKENHPSLSAQMSELTGEMLKNPEDFKTKLERFDAPPIVQGGKEITRVCHVLQVTKEVLEWCPKLHDWPWIKSLVLIQKTTKPKNKPATTETRLHITDLRPTPQKALAISIGHWQVETMHLMLDTTYQEDRCRISIGNAAANLSAMRKLGLNFFVLAKRFHPGTTLMDFISLARQDWIYFMRILTENPWDIPHPKEERERLGMERCAHFGPILTSSKNHAKR